MKKHKIIKSSIFVLIFFGSALLLHKLNLSNKQIQNTIIQKLSYNNKTISLVAQNDKGDIFYGETLYPDQIKASIEKYNHKHNIKILFAENKNVFLDTLKNNHLSSEPFAIYQYNTGHKYGFIFVRYNNINYCIAVDTIPNLSEYTKDIINEDGKIYIQFNGEKYKLIIFGENQQKAMKGCGSFTLVYLKHLLKNNAKLLYEVINLEANGTEDRTTRDSEKKSIIRGVKFEAIKHTSFAPIFYKFSQNYTLQGEFDNVKLKKIKNNQETEILYKDYKDNYSLNVKREDGKTKTISTKIFYITQKYKDLALNKTLGEEANLYQKYYQEVIAQKK